jgi:hypothetical protein
MNRSSSLHNDTIQFDGSDRINNDDELDDEVVIAVSSSLFGIFVGIGISSFFFRLLFFFFGGISIDI